MVASKGWSKQALQTGEVRQVTEGDTTYYVFKARPVFCPFRPLLCFLLLCMQEIQVSHEKGVHSETSCEGGTDVDQKVHSKFKDFVQGYDLNLVPPTPAVGSDPAGGSSCPATLALNEQDKKNLEQSLTLLQTNRQAAEKIYLGITSTTPTAATSRTLLQRNLQNVLGKISELHEVTVFNSHAHHEQTLHFAVLGATGWPGQGSLGKCDPGSQTDPFGDAGTQPAHHLRLGAQESRDTGRQKGHLLPGLYAGYPWGQR